LPDRGFQRADANDAQLAIGAAFEMGFDHRRDRRGELFIDVKIS
jgi:hypothetical protein